MPDPRSRGSAKNHKKKSRLADEITEFVRLMGQIHPDRAASKLQLDMARDAGLEAFNKLIKYVERLRLRVSRVRQKRAVVYTRLMSILTDLATAPVKFPRPKGLPPVTLKELELTYRELGFNDFPGLAGTLRDSIGQGEVLAYERFLVEEILLKGSVILVEHLIRYAHDPKPPEEEEHFLVQLKHHLVGLVNHGLAKQTGHHVTPALGKAIDAVVGRALSFLVDLHTSDPPARLIAPNLGSDFDPDRHEAIAGRPSTGLLHVRATIFPGYMAFEPDGVRIVAKAKVFTKRQNGHSSSEIPVMPKKAEKTK